MFLKYAIHTFFLEYIFQHILSIFLNKSSAHSAKTVFPLLSQKHINIVFMPDMEIPGGKSAFIPVLFHTFASQSKSLERQIGKLAIILSLYILIAILYFNMDPSKKSNIDIMIWFTVKKPI